VVLTVSTSTTTGVSLVPATQQVTQGSTGQVTVTVQAGYENLTISGCNGSLAGATYTVNPTASCTVTAAVTSVPLPPPPPPPAPPPPPPPPAPPPPAPPPPAPPPPAIYAVSTSTSAGVTLAPALQQVTQGNSGQITVTVQSGYGGLAISGCNGSLSGVTYTVNPAADCTVTAAVTPLPVYTVSVNEGPGTSITPSTLQVAQGSTGALTVMLLAGYRNLSVSGCNGALIGANYTVSPTANCTVTTTASVIPAPSGYTIETVAGNGNPNLGDGGPATSGTLVAPDRVLMSSSGVLYISDTDNNRVASVSASGVITTFAGRVGAEHQPLGDGGPATDAVVRFPRGLFETVNGLYIGDHSYTVRLVNPAGQISNAAITDRAAFILSWGLAVDSLGRIYIADISHHRVLRAELNGTLTVIAGTGVEGSTGDGGQADQARLSFPRDIRLETPNILLIGSATDGLRQVNLATGVITPRLSNVMPYFDMESTGDFITGRGNRVLRINRTTGAETVIAGTGAAGFSGDGGPALSAQFGQLGGISLDGAGNVYVADTGNARVRKIVPGGTVTTVAGGGPTPKLLTGVPDSQGIAFDPAGRMFMTDFQYHFLRRALPNGSTKVIAGNGGQGTSGDGGPAIDATFSAPSVMTFDNLGRLFFLDLAEGTGSVRMIAPGADGIVDGAMDETITTIAGRNVDRTLADNGAADGGPARNAVFNALRDFAFDTHGNLILPDWQGNSVRKVTPGADGIFNGAADEIITTIAGNGSPGQTGDGGAALAASIEAPTRIVIDAADNIYIHVGNNTPTTAIRRIDGTTGVITTIATSIPVAYDMVMDGTGTLFYADGAQVIRVNTTTGASTVVAGTGARGFSGDGGDALAATFRGAGYVEVDDDDNIYVADNGNFRIRRLVKR
jgi:hypothetical protein